MTTPEGTTDLHREPALITLITSINSITPISSAARAGEAVVVLEA
ncbi:MULTISPECIES: hypothetical protein [unclassified Streptomyces]